MLAGPPPPAHVSCDMSDSAQAKLRIQWEYPYCRRHYQQQYNNSEDADADSNHGMTLCAYSSYNCYEILSQLAVYLYLYVICYMLYSTDTSYIDPRKLLFLIEIAVVKKATQTSVQSVALLPTPTAANQDIGISHNSIKDNHGELPVSRHASFVASEKDANISLSRRNSTAAATATESASMIPGGISPRVVGDKKRMSLVPVSGGGGLSAVTATASHSKGVTPAPPAPVVSGTSVTGMDEETLDSKLDWKEIGRISAFSALSAAAVVLRLQQQQMLLSMAPTAAVTGVGSDQVDPNTASPFTTSPPNINSAATSATAQHKSSSTKNKGHFSHDDDDNDDKNDDTLRLLCNPNIQVTPRVNATLANNRSHALGLRQPQKQILTADNTCFGLTEEEMKSKAILALEAPVTMKYLMTARDDGNNNNYSSSSSSSSFSQHTQSHSQSQQSIPMSLRTDTRYNANMTRNIPYMSSSSSPDTRNARNSPLMDRGVGVDTDQHDGGEEVVGTGVGGGVYVNHIASMDTDEPFLGLEYNTGNNCNATEIYHTFSADSNSSSQHANTARQVSSNSTRQVTAAVSHISARAANLNNLISKKLHHIAATVSVSPPPWIREKTNVAGVDSDEEVGYGHGSFSMKQASSSSPPLDTSNNTNNIMSSAYEFISSMSPIAKSTNNNSNTAATTSMSDRNMGMNKDNRFRHSIATHTSTFHRNNNNNNNYN